MRKRSSWALPYFIFLLLFVVAPLLIVAYYAVVNTSGEFTLTYLSAFFTDGNIFGSFLVSLEIALYNTLLCILIGYPVAYILADKEINKGSLTAMLFIAPMAINALMRTISIAEIFSISGIGLGKGTLIFGMVYDYLPFMIFPIYNVLNRMDKSYIEAAQDLGAGPVTAFFKVTLPLSMPGILSGAMMVFMPTVSTFAVSEILTNNTVMLFGSVINEQFNNLMWNQGAALSFIMLIIIGITMLASNGKDEESAGGLL